MASGALTALTTAALAGVATPAAQAADDCPNAAVRAQQQSQHLPNCMAYEKVTPEDKGGEAPGVMWSTADGGGLLYVLNAGIADTMSFVNGRYRALRSPDGRWTTNGVVPAFDGPLPALNSAASLPHAATPDLSRVLMDSAYPIHPNDQGVVLPATKLGTQDLFIREADGSFRWLVPDTSVPDTSLLDVSFAAASTDLEQVLAVTARQWDPRVEDTSVQHLYVWTRTGTHLATVLPNGDLATGLRTRPGDNDRGLVGPQLSADGRRVLFSDDGDGSSRVYVRFNADDPATAVTREVAVGPNGEFCQEPTESTPKLSADGQQLLFRCNVPRVPGGLATGTYLRDLDGGAGAVRRVGDAASVLAATPDFSRVYLSTLHRDELGIPTGPDSVHILRDGGDAVHVLTPASGISVGSADEAAEMSDDGEYLTFSTAGDLRLPGVDHSTLNGAQIYRYAARTDELTCVSCRQDGSPTEGTAGFYIRDLGADGGGGAGLPGTRPVSTNGTVNFSTTTALVPEDTNGVADAYAWIDGRVVLLSGGRSPLGSFAQGGSADGSSFIIRTTDALVPDDRDGGANDLYVARVNGGTLLPDPPEAPCTSNCQGPAPERPALPGLGSTDVLGRGNLVEETTKPPKSASRATVSLSASSVRGTSTKVRVKVSRAGSIRVSGAGVRQATVKAKKAGTYRVTVRLSAHGKKQQRSRGRLATRITARFTPESGGSVSARKSVTFTAKKGGR